MLFTIEPMINLGRPHVKVLSDGWTAVTRDRSLSAQFEHTVGVTGTGVEVFTRSPEGLRPAAVFRLGATPVARVCGATETGVSRIRSAAWGTHRNVTSGASDLRARLRQAGPTVHDDELLAFCVRDRPATGRIRSRRARISSSSLRGAGSSA